MALVKIPQHKHCPMCGNAIKANRELCSDECKSKWDEATRKKKNLQLVMYGSIFLMMIFLVMYLFI